MPAVDARTALARALAQLGEAAWRVVDGLDRGLRWLLMPQRLLTLAWLLALMAVGMARMALAQDDIIIGPDLAGGAPATLFEQYGLWDYKLTIKISDEESGWFNVGEGLWQAIGLLNYVLLWITLGLVYGGITLMEWFLNLTVYQDSAGQIDSAVRMVADHVFWPLIPATVAIGLLMAYTRWRGDGRGFGADVAWIVAAVALATGFALGPSAIMGHIDSARQAVASGVVSGASNYIHQGQGETVVGSDVPPIDSGDAQTDATRTLSTSLWETFGATPWCYGQFGDLGVCREAGEHALADDDTWRGWLEQLDNGTTPAAFGEQGDYIRGQTMERTGVLTLMSLVAVPLAWMLLRLVMAGLVAVVGMLLMLIVGVVFLVLWPIEGFLRRVGTQYWIYTLGLLLQATFISIALAAVMVVSTILAAQTAQYGFFLIAVLNIALFAAATKARSWLDMLTTVGGAGSGGFATALIARSVVRSVTRVVAGAVSGGTGAAAGALGAGARAANKSGWLSGKGASADQPRNRSARGSRGAGLDSGPVRATATRMRPASNAPQVGSARALPHAATNASPGQSGAGSPAGAPGAGPGPQGGSGPGPPHAPTASPSTSRSGAARTVSPTDIGQRPHTDGPGTSMERSGTRGRVWAAPPGGRGTAPLDNPPPASARAARGGAPRGATDRGPRRSAGGVTPDA